MECTGDVADDPGCWTTNELGVFVSSDIGDDVAGAGTRFERENGDPNTTERGCCLRFDGLLTWPYAVKRG